MDTLVGRMGDRRSAVDLTRLADEAHPFNPHHRELSGLRYAPPQQSYAPALIRGADQATRSAGYPSPLLTWTLVYSKPSPTTLTSTHPTIKTDKLFRDACSLL
ncbi:hypothetical protein E2C01_003974 [Portunus trituberculatus]|uniref:Uncharacterized protein n=1 Tax=Portunus trituberculatus TaxID=210409 RepID=A0A5B7CR61_PORTR|nr:hypothetical protein [Portunus trituberculatus]